ncbi:MAG: GIY-YIG nuclease family protein [bacterium]|nr:GIY-YIG nuclease family protein [bacterium]
MAKFYYVYVLQSRRDTHLYIGSTGDLKIRFEEHQSQRTVSTKERGPWNLLYYEECVDKHDALHREKYLKTTYGHRFLKSRLKSYFIGVTTKAQGEREFHYPV